ncbi:hypothetical protein [Streptomyces candidus]|uniref:Uncharacterized protein n=1 Tax=Streptomyces candidus TaxID=67283 RepID=A0A7X0HG73_9ACTN|nr:hypothetical protein [Streptomyces candidus]MBB6435727.1 hypothetical protein [Streptomyces candidus]GHH46361.1 hypothetical protein GCM10018773_37210 [Streptomyces candidus]
MPALLLLSAAVVLGFEKFVDWHYGAPGAIGVLLICIGVKARSPACAGVGATVLTLQVIGPGVT